MFTCSNCDTQSLKWQGRCPECGKWGTFAQESDQTIIKKGGTSAKPAPVLALNKAKAIDAAHVPTNISELDRVLSGGIVPGSVILLAGEPGIGKSTLVAQLAGMHAGPPSVPPKRREDESDTSPSRRGWERSTCLYVSGEESHSQVLLRFTRLGIKTDTVLFSASTEIDAIISAAQANPPSLLIIDSIQTMIASDIENLPGSPTAVRAATAQLIGYAKSSNVPILLVGQVTKEGNIAGPKTLEHLVDTVLTLEGDPQSPYRLLRTTKNRFGQTDEVGIFEMTEHGLEAVANPSARFLEERVDAPGSVVTCVMEGTRPVLIEVQALAEKSLFANPIRRTSGFDAGRLQMLLAIIGKRAGVSVSGFDVYVNVVGGMKIKDHAIDLAVCAAVLSSVTDTAVAQDAIYVGEVGLAGEIRSVPALERRIKEAERLGFKTHVTPKTKKDLKGLLKPSNA